MPQENIEAVEQDNQTEELVEADSLSIKAEVEEIKDAVEEVVAEESLTERVEAIMLNINSLGKEMEGWSDWYKSDYAKTLESIKTQVSEVQEEWIAVASTMQTQGERLDTLLQSFPGVIETTTIKALSLRVKHLETLVSKLIEEERSESTDKRANKMFIISLSSLAITIVLWIVWIALAVRG